MKTNKILSPKFCEVTSSSSYPFLGLKGKYMRKGGWGLTATTLHRVRVFKKNLNKIGLISLILCIMLY